MTNERSALGSVKDGPMLYITNKQASGRVTNRVLYAVCV